MTLRLALLALVAAAGCGGATTPPSAHRPRSAEGAAQTVRVAASERYRAGRVHRFFFGGGYRELWKAPVDLPLLDLRRTGGGLTPAGRFGGLQSAVIGFEGADGRRYSFRGTDKDPSAVLPELLLNSPVRNLVQDQMAAQHPGGPIVATALSRAAGVLTIRERMAVMPDDPALGKYRAEFAGMVGTFYEYPTPAEGDRPGFAGATAIIGEKKLYPRLARSPDDRVDAKAYLRARLVDLLLGDFDRHRKQWRWAKIPGRSGWQPIPEDRDQAFVRYDGAGQRLAYVYVPILQCYGPDYPSMRGLTLHGWEQDRWLLPELSWRDWEAIVADLKGRLTDEVIEAALRQLPKAYFELDGARLRDDIRGRRDRWLEGGRRFYEHLAGEVNIQATDATERVHATWTEGKLWIEVSRLKGAKPYFARTFDPAETDEVRIYLRGGNDVVRVTGEPGGIALRFIGGDGTGDGPGTGAKTLADPRGGARFYDIAPDSTVGEGATVVDGDYAPPPPTSGFLKGIDLPPRDWGYEILPFPNFGFQPGVGFMFGAGLQVSEFGFRKHPWSRSHKASASFATGTLLPTVGYSGKYRLENSNLLGTLDVSYDGNNIIRYHGLGNDTANDQDDDFYNVINHQVKADPGLSWASEDKRLHLTGGLSLGYYGSQTEDEPRLISLENPYGFGDFFQTSAFGRVVVDLRTSDWADAPLALPLHDNVAAGYATGGVLLDLRADVTPPLFSAEEAWGAVDASIAGYLGLGDHGRVVLSTRLGQKFTWGNVPYFGAAFLGGGRFFSGGATARGFIAQRFAGDAVVYANVDGRVYLFRFPLFVPTDVGLLAFGDVGRVFLIGEPSGTWHPSGGGGFWLAPLARTNTVSFSVAASEEDVLVYVRAGFHY